MQLHVILPDQGLEAVMAHASRIGTVRSCTRKEKASLAELCALQSPFPVAALMAQGAQLGTGHWFLMRPVQFQYDFQHVVCSGGAHLNVTEEEARALLDALNAFSKEEGISFFYLTPDCWAVRCERVMSFHSPFLVHVIGQPLCSSLWQGEDVNLWQRWLSEWQMLFAQHTVNQARRAAHQVEINGLWIEGGGELMIDAPHRLKTVFGESMLADGLRHICFSARDHSNRQQKKRKNHHVLVCCYGEGDPTSWEKHVIAHRGSTVWFYHGFQLIHKMKPYGVWERGKKRLREVFQC